MSVGIACATASPGRRASLGWHLTTPDVQFVPALDAGRVGWCIQEANGGSCPEGIGREPIVAERWDVSEGPSSRELRGLAVTTSVVAAVSLGQQSPSLPTRAVQAAPGGLRVVSVAGPGEEHPMPAERPVPYFRALDRKGEAIRERRASRAQLSVSEPIGFSRGAATWPAGGACRIITSPLAGLEISAARWLQTVRAHTGLLATGFVSCASVYYNLHGASLTAAVLIGAGGVGMVQPRLPEMRAIAGHPGIVRVPTFAGEAVGRRVGRAWLVVAKGHGLRQRLTVLAHLQASLKSRRERSSP